MKTIIIAAALIIGLLGTENAEAGPREYHSIKHRQVQQQRIRNGVYTGVLTRRETAQLQIQQAQLRHDKKMAKCDGKVTRCERAYIKAEQARAGNSIYMQKHDHQTR